jgi:hypothetical protein
MWIKNNNQDFSLDGFAAKLIEEKGLTNLDEEVISQLNEDLKERLEDRINAMIIEKMPPEKLEEFENLMDKATEEELQKFCQANIVDLDQAVAAELLAYRQIYLS